MHSEFHNALRHPTCSSTPFKDGHGDIENGCPACECDVIGSIGDQCDAVSGQCTCKQGVFGKVSAC